MRALVTVFASVALSAATVIGLLVWQWASITISGDRSCPDGVTYAPVGGYLVPAVIAAMPTFALWLAMRTDRTRFSKVATAVSVAAALFVVVFWAQLLPLVGCGLSEDVRAAERAITAGPQGNRDDTARGQADGSDRGKKPANQSSQQYDTTMSGDRVTVAVNHPSFLAVAGIDPVNGIGYLEREDRVVVAWSAEGSVPDPIMGVEVLDKARETVTLRFASERDAKRFTNWLASAKPLMVALQHREGLVPEYTQGRASGKSREDL